MVTECTFEFRTCGEVDYLDPNFERTTITLRNQGLQFETLVWLSSHVSDVDEDAVSGELLRLIGRNLYALLLPDDQLQVQQRFKDLCEGKDKLSVQLEFQEDAWPLARLPWELLYVPAAGGFFLAASSSKELVLTRHVPFQPSIGQNLVEEMKVLVVVSSPESERTAVGADDLEQFLTRLKTERYEGAFDYDMKYDLEWDALKAEMERQKPDVLHLRGHGERGAVWLAKAAEEVARLKAARRGFSRTSIEGGVLTMGDAVAQLFSEHRPKVVVLEACESADDSEFLPGVAHLLVRHVPAVLAMRFRISQGSANEFVKELYTQIADGRSLDAAVRKARLKLGLRQRNGSAFNDRAFVTPVLYVKAAEQVCRALPARTLPSDKKSKSAPQPTASDGDCPRCGYGAFVGRKCEVCRLWFICPSCTGRLRRPDKARECSECDEPIPQLPWSDDSFASGAGGQPAQLRPTGT